MCMYAWNRKFGVFETPIFFRSRAPAHEHPLFLCFPVFCISPKIRAHHIAQCHSLPYNIPALLCGILHLYSSGILSLRTHPHLPLVPRQPPLQPTRMAQSTTASTLHGGPVRFPLNCFSPSLTHGDDIHLCFVYAGKGCNRGSVALAGRELKF